jgi:hypothetical protein
MHDRVILSNVTNNETGVKQIKQAVIDAATATTHEIVAAVSTKKIRVIAIMLQPFASDVALTWKSGSDAITPAMTWKAGSGWSDHWGPECFFFETAAGEALNLTLGGAVQTSGFINYIEV